MNYYAVQVKTLKEQTYLALVKKNLNERLEKQEIFFPQRKLIIRRQKKMHNELKPIFPGYIFVKAEHIDRELFNIMKKTPAFTRFLHNNTNIQALKGRDLNIITHFLQFGNTAEISKVTFSENDRIIVKSGPMIGLEGNIVKVDKRKKRAKIALDFAEQKFLIDLSFTILEEVPNENN